MTKTILTILLLNAHHVSGQIFVLGDAFNSDGSSDFNNPSFGTNGNPGNQVTTVYRVDDGTPGNPFNSGNAGGTFSPIVVGDIFGTDYRTTTTFDLSSIPAAAPGFIYNITDISVFFEVSSTDEQDGSDAFVNLYAGLDVTTGVIGISPSAILEVPETSTNGTFLNTSFPNSSIDLNTDSSFTFTLDIDPATGQGARFGADLISGASPNIGINGTDFAEVAPRLVITASLVAVPEPSSISVLLLGTAFMLSSRSRNRRF